MPPVPRPVTRVLTGTLRTLAAVAQLRLSAAVLYLLAILAAGSRPERRRSTAIAPALRALVLIPAHNEEADVDAAVRSLLDQDHVRDGYEVVVIADNCTDATARVATAAGATVWERHDPDHPGKGAALSWGLARLWGERPATEAVLFVDADCVASRNLVAALSGALGDGSDAAQANYAVSNAGESSQTALRAAGFSLKHVLRARGRAQLGLSPGLFGTGMAFRSELLRATRWSESVTEDTELFLRLIEDGRSIAYVGDASVSSPVPTSARDADSQQTRWETGNQELVRARLGRLLLGGLARRDRELLGAAAELALPAQSAMVAGQTALLLLATATGRRRARAVALATFAGQAVYVVGGVAIAGDLRDLRTGLADLPAFLAGRLRVLTRVSLGRGAKAWERTRRPTRG